MPDESPRSTFAPTILAGLATSALCAVAAAKPWYRLGDDRRATAVLPVSDTTIDMPLALALSLLVLAGWGVLLVTRGGVRRACAGIALLAALGVVACVATAPFALPGDLRDRVGLSSDQAGTSPTGWFLAAAVGSVLSVLVLVAAWRRAPSWPTMGSRYDAPAGRTAAEHETDLWKALDAGEDPTDPQRGTGPTAP